MILERAEERQRVREEEKQRQVERRRQVKLLEWMKWISRDGGYIVFDRNVGVLRCAYA